MTPIFAFKQIFWFYGFFHCRYPNDFGRIQDRLAGNAGQYAARGILRSRCRTPGTLADLLYHLNDQLVEDTSGDRFMTMMLMSIDGLFETFNRDGEMFGKDRFRELIGRFPNLSAKEITRRINRELAPFLGRKNLNDDLTFVIVKVL